MAKFDQFGSVAPGQTGSPRDCLRYEAMLADVLDDTLSADEQAAFDRHRETCDSCSAMLSDARRGAAWLAMLKPHRPEPPTGLVDRILAETSVRAVHEAAAVRAAQRAAAEAASLLGPSRPVAFKDSALPTVSLPPVAGPGKLLSFRSRVPAALRPALNTILQTRFAMTAAMAFFSVALTLNLTGVRLSDLHARDLRPASLRRSFYEANAHVARYYENLRVVYELESRVRDLQRSGESESPAPQPAPTSDPAANPGGPAATPQTKPAGKPHSGLPHGSPSGSQTNPRTDFQGGSQSGSQTRSRDSGSTPGSDLGLARRHSTLAAPQGAILPVSLFHLSPDRQKRGLA